MTVQKVDSFYGGNDILHIHGTNTPLRLSIGNFLLTDGQHVTENGKPSHVELPRAKPKVEPEQSLCSEMRCVVENKHNEQKPKWNTEQVISKNAPLKPYLDLIVRNMFFVYTFHYLLLSVLVYISGANAVCYVVILVPFWIVTFIVHGVVVHGAIPSVVALCVSVSLVQSNGCISQTRRNTQIALKEQHRLYNEPISYKMNDSEDFDIANIIYTVVFFVSYLTFYGRCFYEVRSFYSSGEFSARCLYWLPPFVVILTVLNFVVYLVPFSDFVYAPLVVLIIYMGTIPSSLPLLYLTSHSQVSVKYFE